MMKKICAVSEKEFEITDDDLKFYEKMGVPTPTLCPEERQRRRAGYRNFVHLYNRKCDATDKALISMYHADQPFPVYENEAWWGDSWSATDYAQDIDWDTSFFDQYKALADRVPRFATFTIKSENCRYSNFSWESKDCYLVFGCVRDDSCSYGHIVWDSQNCFDNLYCFWCEWCSECVDCSKCYDVHFSTECANCSESYFLHDCRGCKNCFGCTNLRNKEYYWFNEFLGKEAYEAKIAELKSFSREVLDMGRQWLEKEKQSKAIFPDMFGVNYEDCTGNHFHNSKNCLVSFDVKNSEDSKYLYTAFGQQNSYDVSFTGDGTRFCIDCLTIHGSENCGYSHAIYSCANVWLSEFCYNSKDLFLCNGLRNKQYCILNKQYSKEEYFELKAKIIEKMKQDEEWGEFFPLKHSPFAYNESIVHEYMPLSQKEMVDRGLLWKEPEVPATYSGPKQSVPDTIEGVTNTKDSIFVCSATQKPYRVLKSEIDFYKRVQLPLPNVCPDERHARRMALRNPRELWTRTCPECGKEIQTTYAPDRPERVLCEECYLAVVK